jgi:hypothetical protein
LSAACRVNEELARCRLHSACLYLLGSALAAAPELRLEGEVGTVAPWALSPFQRKPNQAGPTSGGRPQNRVRGGSLKTAVCYPNRNPERLFGGTWSRSNTAQTFDIKGGAGEGNRTLVISLEVRGRASTLREACPNRRSHIDPHLKTSYRAIYRSKLQNNTRLVTVARILNFLHAQIKSAPDRRRDGIGVRPRFWAFPPWGASAPTLFGNRIATSRRTWSVARPTVVAAAACG